MIGEVEYLVTLVANHLGLRERLDTCNAAAACKVDVLLIFLHSGDVLLQGGVLLAEAALEHQQVLKVLLVRAETLVNAVFELCSKCVEKFAVLLAVVLLELFQLVSDGLLKALGDEL